MPFDAPADVSAETEALVLDLVEWIAKAPRPYEEVMDAWRTFSLLICYLPLFF